MGAYLQLVTPGIPLLGAFMFNCDLQDGRATGSRCTGVFTTKTPTDAYRGAGRPEATFAIERIMDELAVRARHRADGAAPAQLDQARGVPLHDDRRAHLRQRQLRGRHRARRWSCSATTSCARAGRSGASATTRCSSASASRPTPRCAGWPRPGCSARCRTARAAGRRASDPDAADRQGRGGHRHHPARPGPRDRVEPDRRGRARRAVRGRRRDARRHRSPRPRAWTPTGRARWSSAASPCTMAAQKVVDKARKVAAHLLEAAEDDLEFAGGTFSVQGLAGREEDDPGDRAGHVRGARPARRAWSRRSTPTPCSTRTTSPSRTAPTCARSRSTPRPAGRRSASTSRWTTSAR